MTMQPVRMKAEVPTDVEGIRKLLLAMAPQLEARQPGITAQLQYYNFQQPMMMMAPSGEAVTITFEPVAGHGSQSDGSRRGTQTAIKVEVKPPAKPLGPLRARFWRWRTRWMVKLLLKRAKLEVERKNREPLQPEVLPPER
jgi:hypothetical protein